MWLKHPDPRMFHEEAPNSDGVLHLRYLGTAGFVLEMGQRTIVLDPFVSRFGILRTLFGRLEPDHDAIRHWIPRADEVLVGHAHHDHVLDAPVLCRQTGARLIGSRAVCNVGRSFGLSEAQLRETSGQDVVSSGALEIRGLPSRHGRVYFNRVTLPGDIPSPPPWPPRVHDLRHGDVLNWHVSGAGASIVHIDSADFIEEELRGLRADVLCLCAIGRRYRPDYVRDAVRLLKPRWVVPCHWEWFFDPIDRPARCLPGVNLAGFVQEVREAGSQAILLPTGGRFTVSREC
ncbi:MAG: MBL fold metallo-hydrolase [Myxococcota bacterium]|jgi:L-ascorbate metabolism protein UlaG (beta-lactamase superfamily)|nr:MBL fold metallo-hydrolase [Myxococcota bacterium]